MRMVMTTIDTWQFPKQAASCGETNTRVGPKTGTMKISEEHLGLALWRKTLLHVGQTAEPAAARELRVEQDGRIHLWRPHVVAVFLALLWSMFWTANAG